KCILMLHPRRSGQNSRRNASSFNSLSGRAVQGKVNNALSFCYKSNKCPLDLHSPAEALSLKVPAILLAYNATEE
ncbi:hypothetical protein JTM76_33915, partial [Pseudomonas aeruginosa]|nr:hypothetical protein [Pseudomonas aeruginosa]